MNQDMTDYQFLIFLETKYIYTNAIKPNFKYNYWKTCMEFLVASERKKL